MSYKFREAGGAPPHRAPLARRPPPATKEPPRRAPRPRAPRVPPRARPCPPATRVSRFTASAANPNVANPAEQVLLDNIPSTNGNHNGGALHFGLDGTLFIGVGDAGVSGNAQLVSSLSGKILRIDPNSAVG